MYNKHTPIPWHIANNGRGTDIYHRSFEEKRVVTIVNDLREQDAAFIVRAVNSHNDLLEACKFVAFHLQENHDLRGVLLTAIAKAENEKPELA